MSITKCVKCDSADCNSQLHFDPVLHPGEWHLPPEWITLVYGDTQLNSAWHFCSKGCLYQWLDSLPLAGDWNKLDETQQLEVKAMEYFIVHEITERTDNFYKQHPELRLEWGFHMEPHIREEQ